MKNESFQAFNGFQENYKQFHITMKLTQQNSVLQIKVQNQETLEKLFASITAKDIEEEKDFANIFVEPIEIMDYIVHNFKSVKIEDRSLKFVYAFGTLIKRAKQLTIKLKQVQKEALVVAQFQEIKLLTQMVKQKEGDIKDYLQKIRRLQELVISKDRLVEHYQHKIIIYSNQIDRLCLILKEKAKQIQSLKLLNKRR